MNTCPSGEPKTNTPGNGGTDEHHRALETHPLKAVGSCDTWDCTCMGAIWGGCATQPQHQVGTWNKDYWPMCHQIWGYSSAEPPISLSFPFLCLLPVLSTKALSTGRALGSPGSYSHIPNLLFCFVFLWKPQALLLQRRQTIRDNQKGEQKSWKHS